MKIVIAKANHIMMFIHTIHTWLVAHLLHPIIFVIYFLLRNHAEGVNWGAGFFFIPVFAFFASIPSLFITWILLYVLTNTNLSVMEKFIAWMISVVVVIFINFAGLKMLLGAGLGEVDDLMAPPLIAAILSTLVRHKQFFAFQLNYNSIKNENKLV